MSTSTCTGLLLSTSMVLAALAGSASAVPVVYNVGVMPGGTYSYKAVVSSDGNTVSAFGNTTLFNVTGDNRTFRWTVPGGITHIVPLAEARGGAIGADGFGFSGGSGVAGNGFHWSIPGGVTLLNPLSGDLTCRSTGISSGSAFICGSSVNGNSLAMAGRRAVRWTYGGVATNLGIIPGGPGVNPGSDAQGISSDGTTVVGFSQWDTAASTNRAFRWQAPAGPMQNLGTLPGGTTSRAVAVSSDNLAVTGDADTASSGGQPHAFRWTPSAGMQDLGVIPGDAHSWGYAINGNGSCIVGASYQPFPVTFDRAALWTAATGMVDLKVYAAAHGANVTGWQFTSAWGVSSDGTVVSGDGFFNGQPRAFVIKGLPCISGYFVQNPIPTWIALSIGTTGGAGTTAQFTAQAEGAGPLEYSWTVKAGAGTQPVTLNGPRYDDPVTGVSFTVAGWDTPQIVISEMRAGTQIAGLTFHANVFNPCGMVASEPALLTIRRSCAADFNQDTSVDFFDYLDFVDAFSTGSSAADFNHDGSMDFFDYLDFVDAFSIGC